ncbi:hypothetical protein TraAM80_03644 [Trypanosoma rangeli]|uniref:Uncharacterized protein n=1 Tax=Trypanosoma rangeli TaxID=5698 RepID=A0A3R7KFJ2_TRYRA|nr:uncharacterized protein TraAM80_03644 [Trypanosoma rangeli]RNF06811.1 hypothetical protein TraAM80_03644 [Trypanosoma rangeli]|eukprot:RNF06811.1 hypothetical protein TraAM80_03644 [Trypanosoma rangeli]
MDNNMLYTMFLRKECTKEEEKRTSHMETKVEATFNQLQGILDEKGFGSWKENDANLLLSLLDGYYTHQRRLQTKQTRNPNGEAGTSETVHVDDETVITEADRSLTKLRHFLQQRVPYGLIAGPNVPPVSVPTVLQKCGAAPMPEKREMETPSFSVDAFIYLEEDVEELVQRGCIAREYCRGCGSLDIGLCDFITHSFSQEQLVYLSCFLLPALSDSAYFVTSDLCLRRRDTEVHSAAAPFSCHHVVDVGSRLGVVLLSCYFAAQQKRLANTLLVTGVELDDEMVNLQRDVIKRFATKPTHLRLDVVHSSCFEGMGAEALCGADVIILHNVFEYFTASPLEHLKCWQRLRKIVTRRGQLLVCCPSLEETFSAFTEAEVHGAMNGDGTATESALQRRENDFARKRPREGKQDGCDVDRWYQSWVEEIDVAEVRDAFLTLYRGNDSCHAEGHSSCDGEADGELTERLRSVRVYKVKE